MDRRGFTLIELMITITVVVILALLILTQLNPMLQIFKGYDTVRKTDLAKLKLAFENYYEDKGCYPPEGILDDCGSTDLAPYIDEIPCDPSTGDPYELYFYPSSQSCNQNFVIYSSLANVFDPQGKDIPYCTATYAVYSPATTQNILIAGCSGQTICSKLYGCVAGACTLIAEDSLPLCYPSYCNDNTCNNKCGNPSYECISQ
jgi:prepilin-type N-terminal cleavage/methylation domain-containing protein